MITGVRIAAFCEAVDHEAGPASILNLWQYELVAGNSPGAVEAVLFLQLDLDATPTRGNIRVAVGDFDEAFPFSFQTDNPVTAMMLQLLLPVLRPGALTVSIVDEAAPEPWRLVWRVRSEPGSPPLEVGPEEILRVCRAAASELRQRLIGDGAMSVN